MISTVYFFYWFYFFYYSSYFLLYLHLHFLYLFLGNIALIWAILFSCILRNNVLYCFIYSIILLYISVFLTCFCAFDLLLNTLKPSSLYYLFHKYIVAFPIPNILTTFAIHFSLTKSKKQFIFYFFRFA